MYVVDFKITAVKSLIIPKFDEVLDARQEKIYVVRIKETVCLFCHVC